MSERSGIPAPYFRHSQTLNPVPSIIHEAHEMNKRPLLLLALLATFAAARPAGAWGVEGHEVVATIAYGLLSDHAKAAADALLADDAVPARSPSPRSGRTVCAKTPSNAPAPIIGATPKPGIT